MPKKKAIKHEYYRQSQAYSPYKNNINNNNMSICTPSYSYHSRSNTNSSPNISPLNRRRYNEHHFHSNQYPLQPLQGRRSVILQQHNIKNINKSSAELHDEWIKEYKVSNNMYSNYNYYENYQYQPQLQPLPLNREKKKPPAPPKKKKKKKKKK